jgi:hypothetical protein
MKNRNKRASKTRKNEPRVTAHRAPDPTLDMIDEAPTSPGYEVDTARASREPDPSRLTLPGIGPFGSAR